MLRSPAFPALELHSNESLADLLGIPITERRTIHEWPLSCVQRLVLADGSKRAYKSHLAPTVEGQFYRNGVSSLLPGHRLPGKLGQCETLLLDWIDAPLLAELAVAEVDLAAHGRRLVNQIGEVKGELPVWLDIGSTPAWMATGEAAFDKLEKLIESKRFTRLPQDAVDRTRRWAESDEVNSTITKSPRVIHGDLKPDQVFVMSDGYRVIDWQRPIIAPPEVDLVALLVGKGFAPRRFVDAATIGVFWFLLLHWAVVAQVDLFPDFDGPLFEQWAAKAVRNILSSPVRR